MKKFSKAVAVLTLYDGKGTRPAALNEIAAGISIHLEAAKDSLEGTVHHITCVCEGLDQARPLCTEGGFSTFCKQVGLGRSRAYELLAIADGRKTIEQVRADNAERNKRLRQRKKAAEIAVRHVTDEPKAEIIKPESPVIEGEAVEVTPVEDDPAWNARDMIYGPFNALDHYETGAWRAVVKAHHEWVRAADEALHVSDKAHLEAVANTAELRSALENLIAAANSAVKAVDDMRHKAEAA